MIMGGLNVLRLRASSNWGVMFLLAVGVKVASVVLVHYSLHSTHYQQEIK